MSKVPGRFIDIMYGGYFLGSWSRQLDFTYEVSEDDVTGFKDESENSTPGIPKAMISTISYLDADTGKSHEILVTAGGIARVVSLLIGHTSLPVIGDTGICFLVYQMTYSPNLQVRDSVIANTGFISEGELVGFGIILANTTITNTTDFTGVDEGAQSSNGGTGYLQVLSILASDTYVVKIQDAPPPGSVWSDLLTFTLDGSVLGSEFVDVAGNVDQWVRAQATRTGTGQNFTLNVVFARR